MYIFPSIIHLSKKNYKSLPDMHPSICPSVFYIYIYIYDVQAVWATIAFRDTFNVKFVIKAWFL